MNVIHLRIPPLRERREDILWLARRFMENFALDRAMPAFHFTPDAESALVRHDWSGNVRELKHAIERACILAGSARLDVADLFETPPSKPTPLAGGASLKDHIADCERRYILQALDNCHWQIQRTADTLGISRKTLWEKMTRLGLSDLSPERTGHNERAEHTEPSA